MCDTCDWFGQHETECALCGEWFWWRDLVEHGGAFVADPPLSESIAYADVPADCEVISFPVWAAGSFGDPITCPDCAPEGFVVFEDGIAPARRKRGSKRSGVSVRRL